MELSPPHGTKYMFCKTPKLDSKENAESAVLWVIIYIDTHVDYDMILILPSHTLVDGDEHII